MSGDPLFDADSDSPKGSSKDPFRKYFIAEGKRQTGPFTYEELRKMHIKKDTRIWFRKLKGWTKAEDIPELASLLEPEPPSPDISAEDLAALFAARSRREPPRPTAGPLRRLGALVILHLILLVSLSLGLFYLIYFAVHLDASFFSVPSITDRSFLETSLTYHFGVPALIMVQLQLSLIWGLLNAPFYHFFSGNLGHRIFHIRVVREKDYKPVNTFFAGFLREFLKCFLSVAFIPVIWLLWDRKHQNVYDILLGTLVVMDRD